MRSSSQGSRSVCQSTLCGCVFIDINTRQQCSVSCHDMSVFLTFFLQEVDEFFEQEKTFLLDYSIKIKDSTAKAEKMTRSHKSETISSK